NTGAIFQLIILIIYIIRERVVIGADTGGEALEHHDPAVPGAGRHHQWRDLRVARPGAGAGVRGYPRDPDSAGRVRHLWRADLRFAVIRADAGERAAGGRDGVGGVRPRPLRRPPRAAPAAGRTGPRGRYRTALRDLGNDILVRRPSCADCDQHRPVASD